MHQYLQIKKRKEYIATKISIIRSIFSMFTWIPCDITSASVMMSIPTFDARSRVAGSRKTANAINAKDLRAKQCETCNAVSFSLETILHVPSACMSHSPCRRTIPAGSSIEQDLYRKGNIVTLSL